MSCRGEDQGEAHDARVVLAIKCKLRAFGAGTFHAGLVGDGEQTQSHSHPFFAGSIPQT